MRRIRLGVERLADGSWLIGEDHLDQAEAYARCQRRDRPVNLTVLSRTPIEELATLDAPSWLDRELAEGPPSAVRDAGYGREVRAALTTRRQWLIEQGLASSESGRFRLRPNAYAQLRQRELERIGEALSGELGKPFSPARNGGRIEGVIARRVDLESGSHALVERPQDFTLVPWREIFERNIGMEASGIMRQRHRLADRAQPYRADDLVITASAGGLAPWRPRRCGEALQIFYRPTVTCPAVAARDAQRPFETAQTKFALSFGRGEDGFGRKRPVQRAVAMQDGQAFGDTQQPFP